MCTSNELMCNGVILDIIEGVENQSILNRREEVVVSGVVDLVV